MFEKTRKIAIVGGVLAAVSFGGSALAAAGAAPVQTTHKAVAAKVTTGQKPDKETADGGATKAKGAADKETADGGSTTTKGAADTETADGSQGASDQETADGSGASESGSEVPNNDGPGGHADEPGNPNAQHEAGGQTEE